MASDALKFIIEMVDKLTAPARQAKAALKDVDEAARKATESTDKTGNGILDLAAGISIAQKVAEGILSIASAAVTAATAIANLVIQSEAYALTQAANREQAQIGFEAYLGTAAAAQHLEDRLAALKSPLSLGTREDFAREALSKGFSGKEDKRGASDVLAIVKAAQDLTSISKDLNPQIGSGFIDTLARIQETGNLSSRSLRGLQEAGVSLPKLYEEVGKRMGLTADAVEKMAEAGKKFKAEDALPAAVAAVRHSVDKGVLGGAAVREMETLPGLFSRIASAPQALLRGLESTKGVTAAKGFLSNLAESLDPTSDAGKKVQGALVGLFDEILGSTFGDLSSKGGAQKIADLIVRGVEIAKAAWRELREIVGGVIDSIREYVKGLGGGDFGKGLDVLVQKIKDAIVKIGDTIQGITDQIQPILDFAQHPAETLAKGVLNTGVEAITHRQEAKAIVFGADAIDASQQAITSVVDAQGAQWRALGIEIAAGFRQGIVDGSAGVKDAAGGMVDGAAQAAKDAGQIHSPSEVFKYFGLMTAHGFAEGIDAGQGKAEEAAGALFDVGKPDTPAGGIGPGRGGSVVVQGPLVALTLTGGNPEENEGMIRRVVPELLAEAFERIGLEMGQEPS